MVDGLKQGRSITAAFHILCISVTFSSAKIKAVNLLQMIMCSREVMFYRERHFPGWEAAKVERQSVPFWTECYSWFVFHGLHFRLHCTFDRVPVFAALWFRIKLIYCTFECYASKFGTISNVLIFLQENKWSYVELLTLNWLLDSIKCVTIA